MSDHRLSEIAEAEAALGAERSAILGAELAREAERQRLAAIEASRELLALVDEFNQAEAAQVERLLELRRRFEAANIEVPALRWVAGSYFHGAEGDLGVPRARAKHWATLRSAFDRSIDPALVRPPLARP